MNKNLSEILNLRECDAYCLVEKKSFAAKAFISKELDHLEQRGLLTKIDYSKCESLTVYVKK